MAAAPISSLDDFGMGPDTDEDAIALGAAILTGMEEDHAQVVDAIEGAAAVAQAVESGPITRLTLRCGAVLLFSPVSPLALREAAVTVVQPAVPIVRLTDGRDEPNPNDPDYIAALDRFQNDQIFRVANVVMLMGTKLESVPEGVDKPEDEDWIEMLETLGITVPHATKHQRYLSWLRLYALRANDEVTAIIGNVVRLSGVTEVEVQRAASAFRGTAQR